MKRKRLFFGLLISLAFGISRTFAAESLEKLLSGYLANDMQLRELSIEMKRTLLENEISGIQNGFSFKISTGTITFVPGSDAYVNSRRPFPLHFQRHETSTSRFLHPYFLTPLIPPTLFQTQV